MSAPLTNYVQVVKPVGELGRFDAALAARLPKPTVEELLRLWTPDRTSGEQK